MLGIFSPTKRLFAFILKFCFYHKYVHLNPHTWRNNKSNQISSFRPRYPHTLLSSVHFFSFLFFTFKAMLLSIKYYTILKVGKVLSFIKITSGKYVLFSFVHETVHTHTKCVVAQVLLIACLSAHFISTNCHFHSLFRHSSSMGFSISHCGYMSHLKYNHLIREPNNANRHTHTQN